MDVVDEDDRADALIAFLSAGLRQQPSRALMVEALADARRAVAACRARRLSIDGWLADQIRLRGIRKTAAFAPPRPFVDHYRGLARTGSELASGCLPCGNGGASYRGSMRSNTGRAVQHMASARRDDGGSCRCRSRHSNGFQEHGRGVLDTVQPGHGFVRLVTRTRSGFRSAPGCRRQCSTVDGHGIPDATTFGASRRAVPTRPGVAA